MVSGHDGDPHLARALAGGKPYPTGWFRLYFEDERWEWSPEVERLHGYEPGTAKPTTSMVLSHKHPEDYEQVAATLDDIRRTHQPFSTRHRIIDVQERIHDVIVVADLLRDEGGQVIGTNGFYCAPGRTSPGVQAPVVVQRNETTQVVLQLLRSQQRLLRHKSTTLSGVAALVSRDLLQSSLNCSCQRSTCGLSVGLPGRLSRRSIWKSCNSE